MDILPIGENSRASGEPPTITFDNSKRTKRARPTALQ
jgi:hypothetical protein